MIGLCSHANSFLRSDILDFGVWISMGMLLVKSKLSWLDFISAEFVFLLFFINQKTGSKNIFGLQY
ncbi:MAG: hypothetical protein H6Q27_1043 [Ignavibacteriaceae bacterium]|nr:hypothetical protein [Ignavibacteriaceae bacterium]